LDSKGIIGGGRDEQNSRGISLRKTIQRPNNISKIKRIKLSHLKKHWQKRVMFRVSLRGLIPENNQ
jgi:hypothetical protein